MATLLGLSGAAMAAPDPVACQVLKAANPARYQSECVKASAKPTTPARTTAAKSKANPAATSNARPKRSSVGPPGLLRWNMTAQPGEPWSLWACGLGRSFKFRTYNDAYFGIQSTERENRTPALFDLLVRAPWGKTAPANKHFTIDLVNSDHVIWTYSGIATHSDTANQPDIFWANFEWQMNRVELARAADMNIDEIRVRYGDRRIITLREVQMAKSVVLLGDRCKGISEMKTYGGTPVA